MSQCCGAWAELWADADTGLVWQLHSIAISCLPRSMRLARQPLPRAPNDAVTFHLSPLANPARDLVALGTFPRASEQVGLTVFVPTARYMLALKLKAVRVAKFAKATKDLADINALLRVLDIKTIEDAIAVLAEYFPKSAADADKQRFVLKYIFGAERPDDAPSYPRTSL